MVLVCTEEMDNATKVLTFQEKNKVRHTFISECHVKTIQMTVKLQAKILGADFENQNKQKRII